MIETDYAMFEPAEAHVEGDKPWLVTFADLFCLLLAFFALIFSVSQVEMGKWKKLTQAFAQRVEQPMPSDSSMESMPHDAGGIKAMPALDLGYLGAVLEAQGKSNILLQSAAIYMVGERLVISLPADLLFAPGSAAVETRGGTALFDLASVLRNIANGVEVVGHSDPTPVSGEFTSNWDLSLARAEAVAESLNRGGFNQSITAFGVSDSHFSEIPADLPWQRRLALARRVDILLTPRQGGF